MTTKPFLKSHVCVYCNGTGRSDVPYREAMKATRVKARKLREKGKTYLAIAQKLNVSQATAYNYTYDVEVDRHPRKGI